MPISHSEECIEKRFIVTTDGFTIDLLQAVKCGDDTGM